MTVSTVRLVRPQEITPAMLISTNVPENEYIEYSGAASYPLGQRVIVTSEHKVYQSLVAGNQANPPATSPDKWVLVGPTNRWRAFDQSNSTRTARATSISYRLRPGKVVQSLAALNLVGATSIRVRIIDPGLGVIYDTTRALAGQLLASTWWDWFFGERSSPKQIIFKDLPAAPAADVVIDLVGTDELAVGVLMLGTIRTFSLGVQLGARLGITDFSRKERNEFGDTIVVERPFSRRANWPMFLQASEVDAFVDFMAEVRAIPCLWIGSERYECMAVYGFYKNFEVLIAYSDYSTCDLELEGLT